MILANSPCSGPQFPLVGILAPHRVGQAESPSLMPTVGLLRHCGNGSFEPSSFQCWGMEVGVGWCWEVRLPH